MVKEQGDNRFSILFDMNPHALVIFHRDGTVDRCNRAFCDLTGFNLSEVAGRSFFELEIVLNVGKRTFEQWFKNVLKRRRPSEIELQWRNRQGDVQQGKASFDVLKTGRRITGFLLAIQTPSPLENDVRELRLALDATTDGVWTWNFSTDTLWFSARYYQVLGYEDEAFEPDYKTWLSLIHPDDRAGAEAVAAKWLKAKLGLYENEFRLRRKEGDYIWVRASGRVAEWDDQGQPVRMIGKHENITQHRKSQRIIDEQKHRLEQSQRLTHVGHWEWRMADNVLLWSDEVYRIFGQDRTTFHPTDSSFEACIHPDDLPVFLAERETALRENRDIKIEHRIVRPGGEIRTVIEIAEIIRDESNRVQKVLGAVQDITEQKMAERALRESESRFRSLVDAAPVVILLMRKGKYIYGNPAGTRLLGYSKPEDIVGLDVLENIAPQYHSVIRERIKHVSQGIQNPPMELEMIQPDGSYRWTRTSSVLVIMDGEPTTIIVGQDITEEKRIQQALQESETKFRSIVHSTPLGLFICQLDGRNQLIVSDVNPATCRFLNQESDSFIGKPFQEVFSFWANTEIDRHLRQAVRAGETWQEDDLRFEKEGSSYVFQFLAFPIEPGQMAVIFTDVTQNKESELVLKESEAKFRALFDNITEAVALHEIVTDDQGEPVDFIFLDCNPTYETLTHLKKEEIIGKRGLEIIPSLEQKWIDFYGRVALTGQSEAIIDHSDYMDRWWEVKAYCPKPNQFAVAFTDITERKRTEEALSTSERKFRSLVDQASEMLFLHRLDGRLVDVNARALKETGYSRDELLHMTVFDIDPDAQKRQDMSHIWARLNENEMSGQIIGRHQRKDGSIYPAEVSLTAISLEGEPYILALARDVTQRLEAESALKESERQKELILNSTNEMVAYYDADLNIIWANRASARSVDQDEDEIRGKHCYQVWHQRNKPCDNCPVLLAKETKQPQEMEQVMPEGRHWYIRGYPVLDEKGDVVALVEFGQDITQKKKAEEALKEQRDLLELVTETSPVGITLLDDQGQITFANRAAEELLGLTRSKIKERVFDDPKWKIVALDGGVFPADELPFKKVMRFKKRVDDVRHGIEWPNGKCLQLSINAAPVTNDKGDILAVVATFTDITHHLQVQEAQRQLKEFYETILESVHDGIWVANSEDVIDYVNLGMQQIIGIDRQKMIGLNVEKDFSEETTGEFLVFYHQAKKTREPLSYQTNVVTPAGRETVQSGWLIPLYRDARFSGMICTIQDITDQTRAEEAVKESERRLSTLMSNVPGMVYRCENDSHWSMRFVSDGCLDLTGYEASSLMGEQGVQYNDLIHVNDRQRVWDIIQSQLAKKALFQLEYQIVDRNGRLKWVWEQGQGVFSEEGSLMWLEGLIMDIADRREAEEALEKANANLQAIIENTDEYIQISDENARPIMFNQAYARVLKKLLGIEMKPGVQPYSFQNDPELKAWWKRLHRRVLGGESFTEHFSYPFGQNDIHHFETHLNPIFQEGRVVGFTEFTRDITERRASERALQESEAAYRRLFDEALTGNYISTPQGQIVLCNEAFARIAGYHSVDDVLGTNAKRFYANSQERSQFIRRLKKKKRLTMTENTLKRKDGSLVTVLENIVGEFNQQGELIHIKGYLIDITQRKKMENALKESEKKYRILFDNSPTGILSMDKKGNILEVNQQLLDILGSPSVEETRKINMFTFPTLVESGISQAFKEVVQLGIPKNVEHAYTSKWGKTSYLYYHLAPILDGNSCVIGVQANVEDITERKLAENELARSYQELKENQRAALNLMEDLSSEVEERKKAEEQIHAYAARLSSLLAAAPVGIGLVVDRVLTSVNETLCEMTGYAREELLDRSSRVLYPSEEEFLRVGEEKYRQIGEKGSGTVETQWKRKDGQLVDILLSSAPINPEDFNEGVTFTALDITERNLYLNKIETSLAEKEVLLKEVHHRVKNNMQIIISLISLQYQNIDDEKVHKLFSETQDRIRSMALVHEKLYQSENFAYVDFEDYMDSIISSFRQSYKVKERELNIVTDIQNVHLGVDDAIPCGLIINELITNAVKHAFPDSWKGHPRIHIDFCQDESGRVSLEIYDNGVGLPKQIRVEETETLGLHLVYVLAVHQLEGELRVSRKEGACFNIEFQISGNRE